MQLWMTRDPHARSRMPLFSGKMFLPYCGTSLSGIAVSLRILYIQLRDRDLASVPRLGEQLRMVAQQQEKRGEEELMKLLSKEELEELSSPTLLLLKSLKCPALSLEQLHDDRKEPEDREAIMERSPSLKDAGDHDEILKTFVAIVQTRVREIQKLVSQAENDLAKPPLPSDMKRNSSGGSFEEVSVLSEVSAAGSATFGNHPISVKSACSQRNLRDISRAIRRLAVFVDEVRSSGLVLFSPAHIAVDDKNPFFVTSRPRNRQRTTYTT